MNQIAALSEFKAALESAPRNGYVAEIHVQAIKHARALSGLTSREIGEALELRPSFATEVAKMRKIASRLTNAGLDVDQL